MRWVWVLVMLVASAPLAVGQTEGVIGATRVVEQDVPLAAFITQPPDRGQYQSCSTSNLHVDVAGRLLRFSDEFDETACAFARYSVPVPEAATEVEVRFSALRYVTTSNIDTGLDYDSDLWFLDGTQAPVQFIPGDEGGQVTDFSYVRPVPATRTLDFFWGFRDNGELVTGAPGVPVLGQRGSLDIIDPVLRFRGIPATGGVEIIEADVGRDRVEQHYRVEGIVPEGPDRTELVFRVQNALSIHHVELPDGRRLDDAALVSGENAGVLELRLPPEVTQAYGPGVYVAVFSQFRALEPTPFLVPFILGLLIVPFPLGVFATRAANRFQARAVGRFVSTARSLRLALAFWWAVYIAAIAIVVLGRMWPLIVAWPLQVQAALVHGAFVLVALVFIALGFLWRRQLSDTMEAELAEKERVNRDLERSNQELQQFAYVASHDLQEPLRTVARFTQLLERRYGEQLDDQAKEFMAFSVDGAKRMQALIDGLLELSRVETRGRPLVRTDLGSVCDRVIRSLAARVEESGGKVSRGPLPHVLGDELQLGMLLQNLIGNALKFRDPERPIRVRIEAQQDGAEWHVTVKDNGIGIEAKHFQRIFVVFQRLHAREEYEGTGMGLALCKKIVDRHGGRIWVESEPGKGSTFHFTLIDPGLSKPSEITRPRAK